MGGDEIADVVGEKMEEALKPIEKRLGSLEKIADRRWYERFLLLLAVILALVTGVAGIFLAINRGQALDDQVDTNREVVCSGAALTATSPRTRSVGETQVNFVERLLAQRVQLLRSGQLDCGSLEGFATFDYRRGRALVDIERIVGHLAPRRLKQAEQETDRLRLPGEDELTPPSGATLGTPPTSTAAAQEGTADPIQGGSGTGGGGPKGNGNGGGEGGGGGGANPSPKPAPSPSPSPSPAPSPAPDETPQVDPEPEPEPAPGDGGSSGGRKTPVREAVCPTVEGVVPPVGPILGC